MGSKARIGLSYRQFFAQDMGTTVFDGAAAGAQVLVSWQLLIAHKGSHVKRAGRLVGHQRSQYFIGGIADGSADDLM